MSGWSELNSIEVRTWGVEEVSIDNLPQVSSVDVEIISKSDSYIGR
jgi:hypothetical protein